MAAGTPRSSPRRSSSSARQADIELTEIGVIAVDVGPGLFTGMRVGLATAKALAFALRVPMIGISSLDLLAFPHRRSDRVVVPVIDARKGEVFYAMYRQVPGGLQQVDGAAGRVASTTSSPICWPAAKRCCASVTAPIAIASRDPRRLPLRDRRRPAPVGGAAGATRPRPGAARGVGEPVGDRRRCTCASPTPRSTGRRGPAPCPAAGALCRERDRVTPMSVLARLLDRAGTGPAIEPMRRSAHRPDPGHRTRRRTPSRGAASVFHDEIEQARAGHRHYIVARERAAARRLRRADVRRRRGPHHEHRGRTPSHRREGVATRLLVDLARAAIDRGLRALTLEVRASATSAPRRCTGSSGSPRPASARRTTRAPRTRS